MAIINNNITNPWANTGNISSNPNSWVNTYDHAIQGKMLTVRYSMSDVEYTDTVLDPDNIKKVLLQQMVNEIWKENCIEFTKMVEPHTGRHHFAARIFVTPDTTVRILRQAGK
jgi:hypothetical protein